MDIVVAVFVLTYLGMAVGRVPGFKIDRSGIALIGAIVLMAAGVVTPSQATGFVDGPTMMLLFGLMIVAAQFGAAGAFAGIARRIAALSDRPHRLLASVILTSGALSAVLSNDIVVFAMAPLLCAGLRTRGVNPVPYLVALAASANAGSAATLIGNPQNILIGQMTGLGFWHYIALALPVALAALAVVYGVVALLWRGNLKPAPASSAAADPGPLCSDRRQYLKAVLATAILLVLFMTPVPREISTLVIAGALLASRRIESRELIEAVDWNLLILFAALFVVTGAMVAKLEGGEAGALVGGLATSGWLPDRLSILIPAALAMSNTIGNVPAVILILQAWHAPPEGAMAALAILSTLAGNLCLVGSIANIIVAERARAEGVRLGFGEHARAGVPITLISTGIAAAWLALLGVLPI